MALMVTGVSWGQRQMQHLTHSICHIKGVCGLLVSCLHRHEQEPRWDNLDRAAVSSTLCGAGDPLISAGSFLEKGGAGSGCLVSPGGLGLQNPPQRTLPGTGGAHSHPIIKARLVKL